MVYEVVLDEKTNGVLHGWYQLQHPVEALSKITRWRQNGTQNKATKILIHQIFLKVYDTKKMFSASNTGKGSHPEKWGVLLEMPLFLFAPPTVPRMRFFAEGETFVLDTTTSLLGLPRLQDYMYG